eukprot:6208725-Pleurochrysis_carterae.AAC.2
MAGSVRLNGQARCAPESSRSARSTILKKSSLHSRSFHPILLSVAPYPSALHDARTACSTTRDIGCSRVLWSCTKWRLPSASTEVNVSSWSERACIQRSGFGSSLPAARLRLA